MANNNINLLPEEMRDKERKEAERTAHRPKVFTVELSPGGKARPPAPIQPPRESLWSKIFGQKKKIPPPSFATGMKMPQYGPRVDILETAKKQKIEYQNRPSLTPPAAPIKKSFWGTAGPVKPPVAPLPPPAKVTPPPPDFASAAKSQPEKISYQYPKAPKKGIGLGAWLKNIFAFKTPARPYGEITKKEVIKKEPPKPPVKMSAKAKYHVAPKTEKSKLDINLIPEELLFKKYPRSRQQTISIILAVVIPALVVAGAYFLIDQQERSIDKKISQLTEDQNKLLDFISGFKSIQQKNINLQDKLLAINRLLDKHIYWTKFFSLLQRYTLDDVHYTEFTADTSGEFMLPAVASIASGQSVEEQVANSYRQAANQIAAFKRAADFVSQIKVNNLEIVADERSGIKGVKFEINLALTDGVFYQK